MRIKRLLEKVEKEISKKIRTASFEELTPLNKQLVLVRELLKYY